MANPLIAHVPSTLEIMRHPTSDTHRPIAENIAKLNTDTQVETSKKASRSAIVLPLC